MCEKTITTSLSLLLFAQPAIAAEDDLRTCRTIQDKAARADCYDEVVDRCCIDNLDTGEELGESDWFGGLNDEELNSEAGRTIEDKDATHQVDNIEALVTLVRQSGHRKLLLTLDNDQVWRQLDNSKLRLRVGESVTIRKASLGSFLLEKRSGSRAIRVRRVE